MESEIIHLEKQVSEVREKIKNKKKEASQLASELGKIEFTFESINMTNQMMYGNLILDQFCGICLSDISDEFTFEKKMQLFFENPNHDSISNEIKLILPIDKAIKKLNTLYYSFDHMFFTLAKIHRSSAKVSENVPYIFHTLDETDKKLLEILKTAIHKKLSSKITT